MNFRKMIAGLVTALVLMVASVFAFSSPANAALSDCTSYPGTICMAQYSNWGGLIWRQYPSQVFGCRSVVPDNFNDRASAATSSAPGHYQVRLWQHSNCSGNYLTLNSGTLYVFTGNLADIDNMVSAVEVIEL